MMKKRLLALLLVLTTLMLTSCSLISRIRTTLSDLKKITGYKNYGYYSDGTANYEFNDEIIGVIDERFDQLDEMLASEDLQRNAAFQNLYILQLNDIYYISDHTNLAFVKFCKDTTNEEASAHYERMSKLLNEKSARLYRMYKTIYDSPFGKSFYSEWDEEEVQNALEMSEMYSEKHVELSDIVDEYIQEYEKLSENSVNYRDNSARLYENIVKENIKIAKEAEYEQYADYAYELVYSRDYTPEDSEKFYTYVRDYIVPLGNSLLTQLRAYKKLSSVEANLRKLDSESVSEETLTTLLTPYYTALGEDNLEAFEAFKENYTADAGENARPQAFTFYLNFYGHPSCYFGPGYQNLMTYIHEQGHFLSMYKSNCPIESIDLNESQSQGNEWLYMSYIADDYDETIFSYMVKERLLFDILSITLSTCCDAFEQYIYTHTELTYSDYDNAFIYIAQSLGAYDFLQMLMNGEPEEYWHRAIISNSFYYLSYAVSLIPDIELYVISREQGFEEAAKLYNQLTVCKNGDGFVEKLTESGLHSPFDEEVFKNIYNYFTA